MLREFLVNRLLERSSWLGVTAIAGVFGVTLGDFQTEVVVAVVGVVMGLIAFLWPDRDEDCEERPVVMSEEQKKRYEDQLMSGHFRFTRGTRSTDPAMRKRHKKRRRRKEDREKGDR